MTLRKIRSLCSAGIIISLLSAEVVCAGIQDGLAAYYPFNGNANDESGNGNHGTVSGATLATDRFGKPDRAYFFAGNNATIIVPDNDKIELTGDFSFSFWMNPQLNSLNNENCPHVISKHRAEDCSPSFTTWTIRFCGYWATVFSNYNPSYTCGKGWPYTEHIKQWTHIGIVYNKQDKIIKYYKDGLLKNEQSADISILNNPRPLIFGAQEYNDVYSSYKGMLDDIRIYKRSLTAEEINQLYRETLSAQPIIPSLFLLLHSPRRRP